MIDVNTDLGKRTFERLREDHTLWLTTVNAVGKPQPTPIWFLLVEEWILFYTIPESVKVRNFRRNPQVALNFNCSFDGEDVQILNGRAELIEPVASEIRAAYLEKYKEAIPAINMTVESLSAMFSQAVRVTVESVRTA